MKQEPLPDEVLLQLIGQHTFRHTTSARFKDNPHQYIVGDQPENVELYRAMKQKIGACGYSAEYQGHRYRYYHLGGFKYWIHWEILNREPLPDTGGQPVNNPQQLALADSRGRRRTGRAKQSK